MRAGLKQGLLFGAALLALCLPPSPDARNRPSAAQTPNAAAPGVGPAAPRAPNATAKAQRIERRLDFGAERASPDALRVAAWVVASADNGTAPFAIVDKQQARVYL